MGLDYLQALLGGTMEETPTAAYRDIWVVAETRHGALARVTHEMLGRASELAGMLGARVATVLMGNAVAPLAAEAIAYGSDSVLLADSSILAPYRFETYVKLLAGMIANKKPEIVLIAATSSGRDLAPRLAARLQTGLLSECVALDLDEEERLLLATRATHNGALLATTTCPKALPQIATVRQGCFSALPPDQARTGVIEQVDVALTDADVTTDVAPATLAPRRRPLADAPVIVAGGRGIGGVQGFALLAELAGLLGGEVAATRSAVELGWAPRDRMVDVTGASVHPDLYVAVGVSGAFSHSVAIRGARCLAAINRDRAAPIMRCADYAIVGDWRDVVPELIYAIKEAKER